MADSLLENYNPLYDVHLRQYFALPHMQKHLRKMGLLDENARGNEVYERHHAMMDVMLKNRETQLFKMAELRRKLDAAEKVETCRRIRAGLSPESYRKPAKPSRSLSRGRRSSGSGRTRRFSNSYDDKQIIQKMEEDFAEPNDSNPRDAYKRLSANTKKFNYLHKMDDPSLISYTNSLKKQLDRLERFREVTFGVHSVARTQPVAHTSWFFRRRSLPSLTASAPANVLHEPLRSINNMRGRKHSPQTGKLGQSYDSRTSCPPTMRKRRDSNSRLPPISSKTKPTKSPQKAGPKSAPAARLPPAKPSTRGRSTTRKETTTTVTRTVPKQDNIPPISGGIVLVGGGAAAAAAAAAAAVKVASPNPKEEETPAPEPVQQSSEPIQEPVPDVQPSANEPEVHETEPQAEVVVIGDLDREPSPQQEVAPDAVREPSPEQEVLSESAREPTPEQEPEPAREPSPQQEAVSEPVGEPTPVEADATEKENTTPEPVVVESTEALSDRASVASSRHVEEEPSEHPVVSPEVVQDEEVVEAASEPDREPSPEVQREHAVEQVEEPATQQEDAPELPQEQEISHEQPIEVHETMPTPEAEVEVPAEQPVSPEPVQAASPVPTEHEAPSVEEDLSQHPSTPVLTETHSPVEEAALPQEDVSGEEAFEKVIVTDVQTQPEEEVQNQPDDITQGQPEEPSPPSPSSEPGEVEPPMELHQTTMLETESAESHHEVTSPSQVEDEHASATIVDHFPGENHEYTEYDNQGYRSDKESEAETRSVQSAVVSEATRQMSVSDDSEPEYAEEDKISNAESQPQHEDVKQSTEVAHGELIDINTQSVESHHSEHNSPKEEEQFERYEQSQDVVTLGEEKESDSDEAQFGGAEVAAMQEESNVDYPVDEAVVPDQDLAEPYVETVVEPEVTVHDEDEEVQFEVEDEQIAESQVVPSDEPMQSEEEHNTLGNADMMQSVYQEQSQDDGIEHGYGHGESVVEHGNLSEQEVHEVEPMGAVESTDNDLLLNHGSEPQQEHFETSHQGSYPPSPREQEHEVAPSPVDEHHESVIHSETQQHDNRMEMEKEHKDQEHFDNDNGVVSQVRLEITPPDQKVDNEEDVPEFASEAEKRMEDDSMSTDSMIIHEDHTEDSTEAPSDMMSQSVYESRMSPSEYETKYGDELSHETELTTPKSQASEDLEADDESTHHPIVTETEWTEGNKTIHETSVHNEHTDNNGQDFYTETKITTTTTTEHVGSDGDVTNNNEDTKSTTSHEELHTGSNGNVQSGLVLDDLHNDQNVSSI